MELKDIQRKYGENKNIRMSIRCTKKDSKFMKENSISPQMLFDFALEDAKNIAKEK